MPDAADLHKPEESNRALIGHASVATVCNVAGRSVGLIIPFIIAYWYGSSGRTDAFFFSYGVVLFACAVFEPALQSIIVPYLTEAMAQGAEKPEQLLVEVFLGMTAIVILAALVLLVALRALLPMITNFHPEVTRLAYVLLLEMSPMVVLMTWSGILCGTMNACKRFGFPAFSPAIRAGVALAVMFWLRGRLGMHALAAGYVAGELVRALLLALMVARIPRFNFGSVRIALRLSARLKEFLKTSAFQNVGLIAVALNPIVDRIMASWLPEGSVSVFHYASALYNIPRTFFISGVVVVLLSHWSSRYYSGGAAALRVAMRSALKVAAPVAIVVSIALILLNQPLTRLVFGLAKGELSPEGVSQVGWVWAVLLSGFAPHLLAILYTRGLITVKSTKQLMIAGIYMNVFHISLNYALMWRFGLAGIALSNALTFIFAFLYLRWSFARALRLRTPDGD